MSEGYRILERNFRCRQGEIDLVAEDEHDLIFVEVKARRGVSFGLPEDALTIRKRRKLMEVASYYLDLHAWQGSLMENRCGSGAVQQQWQT
jgi:putative endonuclease